MEKMIEDVLLELPAYIGAEPYPDSDAGQDQIIKLADFIRRNFKSTTAEMLEQAFEQSASGALRDAFGNMISVNTYGKCIGIDLIGRILQAVQMREQRKVRIQQPVDDTPAATPQNHLDELLDYVKEYNQMPDLRFWRVIHQLLVSDGKIPAIKVNRSERKRGTLSRMFDESIQKQLIGIDYKTEIQKYFKANHILR
jgi:hypothetical protein